MRKKKSLSFSYAENSPSNDRADLNASLQTTNDSLIRPPLKNSREMMENGAFLLITTLVNKSSLLQKAFEIFLRLRL